MSRPTTQIRVAAGRVVATVLAMMLVAFLVPVGVSAQTSDEEAQQAAREIQAARDQANAAAEALFQARSDLEILRDEAATLVRESLALEQRVEDLRAVVEALAVARFAQSGSQGIPLLTGLQPPKDQVQADVLGEVVNDVGNDALDEFNASQKDLSAKRDSVAAQREAIEEQQDLFAQLQTDAEAEVVRLRQIEEQRLTDEAVVEALAAQQAAVRAAFEEQMLRQAEAEAKARPNPGVAAAEAALAQEAADADAAGPDGSVPAAAGPEGSVPAGGDPSGAVPAVPPSSPVVTPNSGASGGASGGRTGTGGPGSAPALVVLAASYLDPIQCPLLGSAYGDSWGGPRSGGRRHEGVDMLAPTGSPIYAVLSGSVTFKQNRLGGNAVSLVADNGNRYYYAHLSSYEGVSRRVARGDVIGYVGDTGNASGTPHLHFEIHPGGGLAVNPTPSVRVAGC